MLLTVSVACSVLHSWNMQHVWASRGLQRSLSPFLLPAPAALSCVCPALADASQLRSTASFYAWMFFTIACAVFIATILQQWSFAVMGAALSRRVRQMLFRSILRQDIGCVGAAASQHAGGFGSGPCPACGLPAGVVAWLCEANQHSPAC